MSVRQAAQAVGQPGSSVVDLQPDILWEIFSSCANMDLPSESEIPAVDTLRRVSQVSLSWRNVAMTSPAFWGQVLNLPRLEQSREWLNEIVRRTERSWLHVKAALGREYRYQDYHLFVKMFVTEHWNRIRSLDVEPQPHAPIMGMDGVRDWITLLGSPSNLHHLKLDSSIWVSDLLPLRSPYLRTIECSDEPLAGSHVYIEDQVPNDVLSMQHLREIKITSHWPAAIAGALSALYYISPADACWLNFAAPVTFFFGPAIGQVFLLIPHVLPKYLRHAEKAMTSSKDTFFAQGSITRSGVDFIISTQNSDADGNTCFRFMIENKGPGIPPPDLFLNFVASFESLQLKEIKTLSLSVDLPEDDPEIAVLTVKQFIHLCPSIEKLVINGRTLTLIGLFSEPPGFVSLPSLKDIEVFNHEALSTGKVTALPTLLGAASETRVTTV